MNILQNVEFYKALPGIIWPIVILVLFFYLRSYIFSVLKSNKMKIKVGSMEVDIEKATDDLGRYVTDLQEKVAQIETILAKGSSKSLDSAMIQEELNDIRILWVDDFPSNNAFIVDRLEMHGISIDISLSTEDAIKKFTIGDHDIVISDLGRLENGIDNPFAGLELLQAIRRVNKDVPVAIFAGQRGMKYKKRLISEGANEVTSSGVELIKFVETNKARLEN